MSERISVVTVWLCTIVLAFCSIVYELLLAQAMSELYGGSITRYAFTIGFYLFAMGMGVSVFTFVKKYLKVNIIILELLLCLIGGSAIYLLLWSSLNWLGFPYHGLVFGHILIVVVGFLSGLEIPFLVDLDKKQRFSRILALDFIGTLIGAVVFPLLLYPNFTLYSIGFIVATLNLSVAIYLALTFIPRHWFSKALLVIIMPLFTWFFFHHEKIGFEFTSKLELTRHTNKWRDYEYWSDVVANATIVDLFKTPYQKVLIIKDASEKITPGYSLYLDRSLQLQDWWIDTYHESMSFLATVFQPTQEPLDIAILGGGDGILAHQLLKNQQVHSIDIIDIDKKFRDYISNSTHYKQWENGTLNNEKVTIHNADAFAYLRQQTLSGNPPKYDAIVMDLPGLKDGDKLMHLYSQEMFSFIAQNLKPGGVLVNWHYNYDHHRAVLEQTLWSAGFKQMLYTCAHPTPETRIKVGVSGESCLESFMISTKENYQQTLNLKAIIMPSHQEWIDYAYDPNEWLTLKDKGLAPHSIFKPNYWLLPPPKR